MSYGTGRPAVLKDDESIKHCRLLLQHPLAIEDDMRLVSTVELMALRERVHNALSPFEGPVKDEHFEELRRADLNFRSWYATWDQAFSQKYEDAGTYAKKMHRLYIHTWIQRFTGNHCKSNTCMLNFSTTLQPSEVSMGPKMYKICHPSRKIWPFVPFKLLARV